MTGRRMASACLLTLLVLAAVPLASVLDPLFVQERPLYYRVPLKLVPDDPNQPAWALAGRLDWERFLQLRAPVLGDIAWGDLPVGTSYAQVIEVSQKRAPVKVCAATPTSATSDCVAGSGLAIAKSLYAADPNNRVAVHINAGVYPEVMVIDAIKHVTVFGEGRNVSIVRPPVVTGAQTDVQGGACRIGIDIDNSDTRAETEEIELAGFTCWNDAWSPSGPESGLTIGPEAGQGVGVASVWNKVYLNDFGCVGNHDCIHIWGSSLSTDTDVPTIVLSDVYGVGGADSLTVKEFMDLEVRGSTFYSWSNYCESTDTTELALQTVAVTSSGSTTTVTIADPGSAVTDFYAGRKLYFTEGAGAGTCPADCKAAANDRGITDWNPGTLTLTVQSAWNGTCSPTSECDANIAAVGMAGDSPCTDNDWTIWKAATVATQYWKATAFHHGVGTTAGASPAGDRIRINGSKFITYLNDFGPSGAGSQFHVAGMLLSYSSSDRHRLVEVSDSYVGVYVNADFINESETPDVLGIGHGSNGVVDATALLSGVTVAVNNTADDDAEIAGIASVSAGAANLTVSNSFVDVTNTGGGTSTARHLWEANSDVLSVEGLESSTLITTTGTITGWKNNCVGIPDSGDAAINYTWPLPISDSYVGLEVAAFGCRCSGADCVTTPTFDLLDSTGASLLSGSITCNTGFGAMTFTDTRTDPQHTIAAGTIMQAKKTTAGTGTPGDDLEVCVRFTTTRW